MRPRLLAAVAATALLPSLALAAPASAITGGSADEGAHPDVVFIATWGTDARFHTCTGTLLSEDYVLTAAHCKDGTVGLTFVDAEPTVDGTQLILPGGLFVPAHPFVGLTADDVERIRTGTSDRVAFGDIQQHDDYSGFTDLKNWNDVGLIRLDTPLPYQGAGDSTIAPVGTLDRIPNGDLPKTLVTAVGYGAEVVKPLDAPKSPYLDFTPIDRGVVESDVQKLTAQILQTHANPNDPFGGGGTCFGDSGGPVYVDGEIVAVTSYVLTSNCRYINGYQRLDIPSVADWLAGFGL